MNSSRSSDIRTVSANQGSRLLEMCERFATSGVSHRLLRRLASRIDRILRTKAAFVSEVDGAWAVLAESRGEPQLFITPAVVSALTERTAPAVRVWAEGARQWTLLNVSHGLAGPPLTLALEGDWTHSDTELRGLGTALIRVMRPTARAALSPVAVAAHRLTRTLGRVTGVREVCTTVLRYVVRAVPSRVATFAVPLEENELAVVATYGYPLELVEHVRIAPGQGIIGNVYQNRSPVCVPDASAYPGLQRRRPRYRTNSFIALPITAGSNVLGVVCVTDRIGSGPFTRHELLVLRELTAPAALALARERVQRQAEAFAQAAVIDPVSGLFNRRYLQERLEEEIQRAQRTKTPVGLLMLDIDDFKSINDRFGHPAGDTVIRAVSEILRRSVRRFDLCTRFGGEEFAIVMPGSGLENSAAVAERIRQRIAEYDPDVPELKGLRVTASIGLCVSYHMTVQEMLDVADRALYAAKRGGKNRVVGPSPEAGS